MPRCCSRRCSARASSSTPRTINYIGRFADADFVGVVSKRSGVKTLDDAKKRHGDLGRDRPPQRDRARPADVQPHRRHPVQGDRRLQGHLRHRHRAGPRRGRRRRAELGRRHHRARPEIRQRRHHSDLRGGGRPHQGDPRRARPSPSSAATTTRRRSSASTRRAAPSAARWRSRRACRPTASRRCARPTRRPSATRNSWPRSNPRTSCSIRCRGRTLQAYVDKYMRRRPRASRRRGRSTPNCWRCPERARARIATRHSLSPSS